LPTLDQALTLGVGAARVRFFLTIPGRIDTEAAANYRDVKRN
jgi:hypothetical protein